MTLCYIFTYGLKSCSFRLFYKKAVLKNFAIFKENRCFPINIAKFLSEHIEERLLTALHLLLDHYLDYLLGV